MKKLLWFGLVMLFLAPVSARAQSAFDGTWKVDLKTAKFPEKPSVEVLQNGMYRCETCVPPINVKADGQDHKIASDDPCSEILSVNVIDNRTIELTTKENGKITGTTKETVSPDGNTETVEGTYTCNGKGEPIKFEGESTRVAKGPAGSHAISGSWRTTKMSGAENALVFTLKVAGNTLSSSDRVGESFTANFDGAYTPVKGDPSHTMMSVKREGKNTLVETTKLKAKVVDIGRMTVAPDGKTMTIVSTQPQQGTTESWVAEKQ